MAKTTTQKKAKAQPKAKRASAALRRERTTTAVERSTGGGRLDRVRMPAAAVKLTRAEPAEDSNEGKYVYCIIKTQKPLTFGPLGIGADPSDTRTVNYRDIAAG